MRVHIWKKLAASPVCFSILVAQELISTALIWTLALILLGFGSDNVLLVENSEEILVLPIGRRGESATSKRQCYCRSSMIKVKEHSSHINRGDCPLRLSIAVSIAEHEQCPTAVVFIFSLVKFVCRDSEPLLP